MTRSLPVVASNPTGTSFCAVEVHVEPGVSFWLDGNSKITASNGTYAQPVPNALSLPAASVSGGGACPGSTERCRESCYVRGLAKHAPNVYALYEHNAATLRRCLDTPAFGVRAGVALADWIATNAPGGFRWHVSGDVLNVLHAQWIRMVVMRSPNVRHWIYTRTLEAVPVLRLAPNLAVNVSADVDNFREAYACATANGARLCYLDAGGERDGHYCGELPPGSVIFPDYSLRGRDLLRCNGPYNGPQDPGPCGWSGPREALRNRCCPVCGAGRFAPDPLASPWWQSLTPEQRRMVCPTDFFGQSEAHRCGPCAKCF